MHAMIDIEAFGNGTNGLIVSIGAGRFDPRGVSADGSGFFRACISVQDALNHGAHVEGKTLQWWFEQDRDAQKALFVNPEPESKVLAHLAEWIRAVPLEGVWAHGINYDLRMLAAAYARHGQRIPWNYRDERDTRTLFSLVPPLTTEDWSTPCEFPKHDPVGDVIRQIGAVQAAMRKICILLSPATAPSTPA